MCLENFNIEGVMLCKFQYRGGNTLQNFVIRSLVVSDESKGVMASRGTGWEYIKAGEYCEHFSLIIIITVFGHSQPSISFRSS